MPSATIEYHNFEILSDLYGNSTEGDYHRPLRHEGSEYTQIGRGIFQDVKEFLDQSGYSDAIVELNRSGMYGRDQSIRFKIFVPKQS